MLISMMLSSSITTQRGLLWKISMVYEITIQGNQTISVCERKRERERERERVHIDFRAFPYSVYHS